MDKDKQLFIGIDGGGTKCQARLENAQGELLGEGLAGSANPVRGSQAAIESILTSCSLALAHGGFSDADFERTSIVLGLAGVNIPKYRVMIEQWQHPFANLYLTTDLHIACLGAHAGNDGAIVISGTGTSAFSEVAGKQLIVGGHGFPLGDKGSGAWVGWQALALTLESFDLMRPSSAFTRAIAAHFNANSAADIVAQTLTYSPAEYAKLAPMAIEYYEQGDHNAQIVINEAVSYLQALIRRLNETHPPRISIIGGLAKKLSGYFDGDIQALLSSPLCSPETGAANLARTLFTEKTL